MIENDNALRLILADVEFHEGGIMDGVVLNTGPLGPGFGIVATRESQEPVSGAPVIRSGPAVPVARDATKGEVIAAAFKAAADLLVQEAAFGFLYRGQPIYALSRHPDALHKVASTIGAEKVRG